MLTSIFIGLLIVIIGLFIGVVIGHFISKLTHSASTYSKDEEEDWDK